MLSKHEVTVKNLKEFDQLMEKVSGRIDKAKNPKKKEVEPGTKDEPEVKRRRQDMDEDEKRDFDIYLQEIKIKRQELLEKRSARHFRKQQLAKRRTAASQVSHFLMKTRLKMFQSKTARITKLDKLQKVIKNFLQPFVTYNHNFQFY